MPSAGDIQEDVVFAPPTTRPRELVEGYQTVGPIPTLPTTGRNQGQTAVRKTEAGLQRIGTSSQAAVNFLAVPTGPEGPRSDRPTDGNSRRT